MKNSSDEDIHFTRLKKHNSSNTRWKVAVGVVAFLAIIACIIIWVISPKCSSQNDISVGQIKVQPGFQLYKVPEVESFDGGQIITNLTDQRINEASGIAVSRRHRNIIYTFNDSQGKNRLFALNTRTGHTVAVLTISGATNCDWEDISLGTGPGGYTYIYIGDVGGNTPFRCDTIYMVREPDQIVDQELTLYNTIPYTWPEPNCETIMVDPNGDLFLISKVKPGNLPKLYQVPPERVRQPGDNTTRVQLSGGTLVSLLSINEGPIAGGISQSGKEILIKNYENILLYDVMEGESIVPALQHLPTRVPYIKEKQGEAIAWDEQSKGFYTLSEGLNQPLWYHNRLSNKWR